jgi:hypothetical protein
MIMQPGRLARTTSAAAIAWYLVRSFRGARPVRLAALKMGHDGGRDGKKGSCRDAAKVLTFWNEGEKEPVFPDIGTIAPTSIVFFHSPHIHILEK